MMIIKNKVLTRLLIGAGVMVFIHGCVANPAACDPSAGGFITGISCLATDSYGQRITDRQSELSSTQSLTERLRQDNRQLQQERQQTSAQLQTARSQLAAMERENNRLARDLQNMQTRNRAQQTEKARMESRLQSISNQTRTLQGQAQSGNLSEAEMSREMARLTRERDELASALATAMVGQ